MQNVESILNIRTSLRNAGQDEYILKLIYFSYNISIWLHLPVDSLWYFHVIVKEKQSIIK